MAPYIGMRNNVYGISWKKSIKMSGASQKRMHNVAYCISFRPYKSSRICALKISVHGDLNHAQSVLLHPLNFRTL